MNFKTLLFLFSLSFFSIFTVEASSEYLPKNASNRNQIVIENQAPKNETSLHNWLHKDKSNNRISFQTRTGYILLRKEDIISLQINRLYGGLLLNYWKNGKLDTVSCQTSIQRAINALGDFPFLKVSRSAIVNLNEVRGYEGTRRKAHLVMEGGGVVKISRSKSGLLYDWLEGMSG